MKLEVLTHFIRSRLVAYEKEVADLVPTHKTVVNSVGGIMWFTDQFFEITQASKSALKEIDGLKVEEKGDIIQVTADEDLLRSYTTDQTLVNRVEELRSILYLAAD
ncbi:MAG: hypothetical protein HRU46_16585 [Verrucomicrobiales bacterium]|nr:hypothetical protein [Verrucomicrobiales bacterium]